MRTLMVLRWLLLPMVAMILPSCNQLDSISSIDDIEIQADYALPLINSTTTIQDLIEASDTENLSIHTMSDGTLAFNYTSAGPEVKANQLFTDIPDFPFGIPNERATVAVEIFPGVELETLNLESGTMDFQILSSVPEDVNIQIIFSNLIKDGQPFTVTEQLINQGAAPQEFLLTPIDVTGYSLNLDNQEMTVEYIATKVSDNSPVILDAVGGWGRNWEYDFVAGNFTTQEFEMEEGTLTIDLFELGFDGELSLADPQLNLVFENSFGLNVQTRITQLTMINAAGESVSLSGQFAQEGFLLDAPRLNEVGTAKSSTLTLNKDNSNIVEMLAIQPEKIIYQLSGEINPDNNSATTFIQSKSSITTSIEATVPAHGSFKMQTEQETDVDFGQPDQLKSASFKLITTNEMPLGAQIQFYFLDDNNTILDSLFRSQEMILSAAPVDADGFAMTPTPLTTEIEVPANRLAAMNQSKRMLMKINLATTDDGQTPVRITSDQALGVKLGAILSIEE